MGNFLDINFVIQKFNPQITSEIHCSGASANIFNYKNFLSFGNITMVSSRTSDVMFLIHSIYDGSFYLGLPVEDGEFLFLSSQSLLKVFMFLQELLHCVN